VSILFAAIAQLVRVVIMKNMFGMSILRYTKEVLWRIGVTIVMAVLFTVFLDVLLGHSMIAVLTTTVISVIIGLILSLYIGLNKAQRKTLITKVTKKIKK